MAPLVLSPTSPQISPAVRTPDIDRTVEAAFRRNSYLALRDLSCVAEGGVVYLHGQLPTYYLKQVAQELAAGVSGVRRVINRIEIFNDGCRDQRPPVEGDSARRPPFAPGSLR
jgi:hypothetical protein